MPGSAHAAYSLGLALLGGGFYGFLKRQSIPSLVGGVTLGGSMLGGGMLIDKGEDLQGHTVSLAASTALTASMGYRFATTRAIMPAGVLTVAGALSSAYHAKKVNDWSD